MKTILVSGASGVVGYGVLRSLAHYREPLHLIGTSIYTDSVAQGFCQTFELAPKTSEPGYIDWLLHIIQKHNVDLIIPGIEADMHQWNECRDELAQSNAFVLLNKPELIAACKDKWLFNQALPTSLKPYAIESSLENNFTVLANKFGLPFLVKPRCGFGAKGIVKIETAETFANLQSQIGKDLIAQRLVGTDEEEYTTSAFCDGRGNSLANITMKRKLSKDGFTDKAEVIHDEQIEIAIAYLCAYFKPVGPTNFQFRKHHGSLKLLEINPRISSSTSIRTAFGYNESAMAIDYFLLHQTITQPTINKGRAVRYVEDMIFLEATSA